MHDVLQFPAGKSEDKRTETKPTPSSGADPGDNDYDVEIVAVNSASSSSSAASSSSVKTEEDEKKPVVPMETDVKPDSSVSDSLRDLGLEEIGETKDGNKTEDFKSEEKEKKPAKPSKWQSTHLLSILTSFMYMSLALLQHVLTEQTKQFSRSCTLMFLH